MTPTDSTPVLARSSAAPSNPLDAPVLAAAGAGVVKPGLDVDVIAVPATAIVCGASGCDKPATHMLHHSPCGGATPSCAQHADVTREFIRDAFEDGAGAFHVTCEQDITPTNHSFRPI